MVGHGRKVLEIAMVIILGHIVFMYHLNSAVRSYGEANDNIMISGI